MPLADDTDLEAAQVQLELVRAMPLSRRLELALSLSGSVLGLSRRVGDPDLGSNRMDRDARHVSWVRRVYGGELAREFEADLHRRRG